MAALTLAKDKIRILLLEGLHANAEHFFRSQGYTNIVSIDHAFDGEELREAISVAHVIGIRSRTKLTAEVLAAAPKLIAIGCFCIGTNQVDTNAAKRLGIPVFNAPFSNTRSVAELVVAEAVMLLRGISEKNILAHQGVWKKSAAGAREVRGKTLGIVGHGHIGSQVSILAQGMGMQVIYYDTRDTLPLGNARACGSLHELLAQSDVVTLHVPAASSTSNLIAEEEIAAMKPGSYLINAARGNVVAIEALTAALDSGHIAGAAVDVFPTEPASNKDEFESSLRRFNSVILTPHIGGSTVEAQENIATEVAEKLVRYSDNGSTAGAVNFVDISLPAHDGKNRFLHIHHNQPGVMEGIMSVFSTRSMNVSAQYLQTDSDVGYLICDIEGDIDSAILTELRAIEGTIRARRLA